MKIVAILIVIILFVSISLSINALTDNEDLWSKTITKYVRDDLWDDINCYDAGHVLLVPMFYAFLNNDKAKMEDFHKLFKEYTNYLIDAKYSYKYWDLNHMQFNFLASNYINLCTKTNTTNRIKTELLDYLYDEAFFACLLKREKYNTKQNPQYNSLYAMERDYKAGRPTADLYQFHVAILCNLQEFSNNNGYNLSEERKNKINEALRIINMIYKEDVTFIEGDKWILNIGDFDEYDDYAYMHYNTIEENMQPQTQENTTWDTSHFHRIPVFLQIFKNANKNNTEMNEYYKRLIKGLKEQFVENVLIKPDEKNNYYRTTNFMDSRNGIYRYNYKTQKDDAYLPYELSGTMLFGWWTFLGNGINEIYKEIYKTFPLSQEAIDTYVGPNTTRKRNKYVKLPDFFENGFAELNCYLASEINID